MLATTLLAALLAAAAAIVILDARSARSSVVESRRLLEARFQAEALIASAIVQLDDGRTVLPLNGEPASLSHMPEGGGLVRLQDTSGLMDINASAAPQLARLIGAFGMEAREASALADRIVDWRDPDELRSGDGAEAGDYPAGRSPPANRPFKLEAELKRVLGMPPGLADCLAPYVTVDSHNPTPNLSTAPARLRLIFGGGAAPGAGLPGPPVGRAIVITAEAPISDDAVYRLTEWVRLTADLKQPVMIHRAASAIAPRAAPELCAWSPA
jgi:hypothetical protein